MQFCELEETLPRVRRVAGRKFADLQTHCCDRPCWLWVQRVACGTDAQSLRRAIGTVGRQDGASGTSGWAPGGDEVGDLRQMDGGEDGRDRVGVVDGRDHDHPPAAVRTTEAIDPPDLGPAAPSPAKVAQAIVAGRAGATGRSGVGAGGVGTTRLRSG